MPRPLRLAAILLVLAAPAGCGDDADEVGTVRPAPPEKYSFESRAVTDTPEPWTVTGRPLPRSLRGRWEMRATASQVDNSPTTARSQPGPWRLDLYRQSYVLRRPNGHDFRGTAAVEGQELHLQYYRECSRPRLSRMQGRFTYELSGRTLRFTEVVDSCGDGDRAFGFTTNPWRRR